jgi:hypothetical protein
MIMDVLLSFRMRDESVWDVDGQRRAPPSL